MNYVEVDVASKEPVKLKSYKSLLLMISRGVAWSKWGCIASVIGNGKNLEFRNLRCHPRDGSWDVSEPTVPPFSLSSDNIPFQHLCWSPNGTDLAAIDAAGRISIFTTSTFLNMPNLVRSGQTDPPEDLNAVIGAYWLNVVPPQPRPVGERQLARMTC
jgi:mediator of RNA polymerase II transcription subunit 16, fungi type